MGLAKLSPENFVLGALQVSINLYISDSFVSKTDPRHILRSLKIRFLDSPQQTVPRTYGVCMWDIASQNSAPAVGADFAATRQLYLILLIYPMGELARTGLTPIDQQETTNQPQPRVCCVLVPYTAHMPRMYCRQFFSKNPKNVSTKILGSA